MFVFSNLATSIDGKIATASREFFPLGTVEDQRQMLVLRKRSDVVLMGAGTLRTYKKFCGAGKTAKKHPANVILSSALEGISPDWPFFKNPSYRRILFHTRPVPKERLAEFAATCEVIRLPGKCPAREALAALAKLGFKKVLVEGGGGIMWDFASENLIDEYNVTLTPRVLGGTEAPTLVDGPGFEPKDVLNLKLARVTRKGDELFLVYLRPKRK